MGSEKEIQVASSKDKAVICYKTDDLIQVKLSSGVESYTEELLSSTIQVLVSNL